MKLTSTEIYLATSAMANVLRSSGGGDEIRHKKDVTWALDWIIEVAARSQSVQGKLWSAVAQHAETDTRLKSKIRRGLVAEFFGQEV